MVQRTPMNAEMTMDVAVSRDILPPQRRRKVAPNDVVVQTIRVNSGRELINYCYLLINRATNQAVVIDPAWEMRKIQTVLKTRKCQLSGILLTHHHKDHTNLADELAMETGAQVYMSAMEIECYSFTCTNLRQIMGNQIDCAGMQVDVIDTPGHTAGSVCFSVDGYLFTGDTLFIEGCGICKGWGSSPDKLHESLSLLKETFSNRTRIYPGHRFRHAPGKSLEYVKENNIYLKVQSKSEFIKLHMRDRSTTSVHYL